MMTGIMNDYIDDVYKLSIKKYKDLLKEFGVEMVDYKCDIYTKIRAFVALAEKINELEGEEQVQKWKDKLENVFPKKKTQTQADFTGHITGYDVGDHVICFTNYKAEDVNGNETCYFRMNVKCKIIKINKKSITLVKWNSTVDFSGYDYALANQCEGHIKFKWTNSFGHQKEVVKDLSRITRKCDDLEKYQKYCEESSYRIDFGN